MKFKKIGTDVQINSLAKIVRPHLVELGNHISIDMGAYISTSAIIGDYIHIAQHTCIIGGADALLIMEDFAIIAAGSKILCASDDFSDGLIGPIIPKKYKHIVNKTIVFKRFSAIGVNCVVMPGVTLSQGSVVGAHSFLNQDTEPWTIYIGNPAKPVKKRKKELVLKGARELGYR